MNITALSPARTASTARVAQSQPVEQKAPEHKVANDTVVVSGQDTADMVEMTVGGATGIAGSIVGMYAGILGGAVVGSLAGGAFGPVVASVGSKGALGFIATGWNTMTTLGKAGTAIGGLSGAVGGWKAGRSVGRGLAKIFGGKSEAKESLPMSKVGKAVGSIVAGTGLASGVIGGGLIGGGIGATGSLLARGFTLSGMGTPALIGAGIGAVTMGLVNASGGYSIAKTVDTGVQKVFNKVNG